MWKVIKEDITLTYGLTHMYLHVHVPICTCKHTYTTHMCTHIHKYITEHKLHRESTPENVIYHIPFLMQSRGFILYLPWQKKTILHFERIIIGLLKTKPRTVRIF